MAKGSKAAGASGIRAARARPSTSAGKGRARTAGANGSRLAFTKPDKGTRAERLARIEARAGAQFEAGQRKAGSRAKSATIASKAKGFHQAVVSGKRAFAATAALRKLRGS